MWLLGIWIVDSRKCLWSSVSRTIKRLQTSKRFHCRWRFFINALCCGFHIGSKHYLPPSQHLQHTLEDQSQITNLGWVKTETTFWGLFQITHQIYIYFIFFTGISLQIKLGRSLQSKLGILDMNSGTFLPTVDRPLCFVSTWIQLD